MALSDLAVFNEQVHKVTTEVLDQQIGLFNSAAQGTLILTPGSNQGDFSETAMFKNMGDILRRRNPYGSGKIEQRSLAHIKDVSVKVASGTQEIRLDPGQFNWIKQSPTAAAVAMGRQLAVQRMADYLNTAIGVGITAIGSNSDCTVDVTADSGKCTLDNLLLTSAKFGDRSQAIRAWVMHSASMNNLQREALKNSERLFTFGSVNLMTDGFGRVYIVTDSDNLHWTSADNKVLYNVLGLTEQAVVVEQNDDFTTAGGDQTGDENIMRTFQAEWSSNYGVKGYAWAGAKAPTDSALFSAANWKRYATSHKDTAGVILKAA